ncbi:MAG: glycoside hydrolase family 5 protein [Candidatus Hodarchaeota archaeon]
MSASQILKVSLIIFVYFISFLISISVTMNTNKTNVSNSKQGGFSRGINLGNALEAPREGDWGVYLKEKYFQLIKDAGFDFIRVPIRWSAHASSNDPYSISTEFFKRIDWVIDQSLSRNLTVIINIHHYEDLMNDPHVHKSRFLSIWRQISTRYQDYSENLYFELLNEPTYNLNSSLWNQYLQEAIEIIRNTNPNRTLIVGPTNWNNLFDLEYLILPEDDSNIIATFHYYSPFLFTHQGAEWVQGSNQWLGTKWTGTESEKEAIRWDLNTALQWAQDQNKTLLLGEFGAYNKAEMESRVRWTNFVAREAEKRQIAWAYWEFCAGFGIYDQEEKKWRLELLEALVPTSPILTRVTTSTNHTTRYMENFFSIVTFATIALFFYRYRRRKT